MQRPWASAHWPGAVVWLADFERGRTSFHGSFVGADPDARLLRNSKCFQLFFRQRLYILRYGNDSEINCGY
jgi:hypothetical protein